MITYDEARKMATNHAKEIGVELKVMTETADAYIFGNEDYQEIDDKLPVVVLKAGKMIRMSQYTENSDAEEIKTWHMSNDIAYVEPADYIPIEIRRKYCLGEFAKEV